MHGMAMAAERERFRILRLSWVAIAEIREERAVPMTNTQTIEQQHRGAWARYIMDAGATTEIAERAIELAALNGLFDIHREAQGLRELANDWRVSAEAIGIRVRHDWQTGS